MPRRHRTLQEEVRWRPPKCDYDVPAPLVPDGVAPRTQKSHPSTLGGLSACNERFNSRVPLVASEEKASGPAGLNPNKHSELWLAKHGNQDSVGGFKAVGHKAGDKKMSAEDAVAKNLAVAKTQAEAATDTPEEVATLAPQVAEQALAPAAIAAAVAADAGLALAASKSKFDCVSLSPTATDNWCLTTCVRRCVRSCQSEPAPHAPCVCAVVY